MSNKSDVTIRFFFSLWKQNESEKKTESFVHLMIYANLVKRIQRQNSFFSINHSCLWSIKIKITNYHRSLYNVMYSASNLKDSIFFCYLLSIWIYRVWMPSDLSYAQNNNDDKKWNTFLLWLILWMPNSHKGSKVGRNDYSSSNNNNKENNIWYN